MKKPKKKTVTAWLFVYRQEGKPYLYGGFSKRWVEKAAKWRAEYPKTYTRVGPITRVEVPRG